MATDGSSSEYSAEIVGHAFVAQFYNILHESPDHLFRFYQDSSTMSRPDVTGNIVTSTTMKGINEQILALAFKDSKTEIMTADAQASYMDGVIVLVTGCFTGKDNNRRRFTESFFLAPQEKGYFVLNDAFRFVDNDTLPEVELKAIHEDPSDESLNSVPEAAEVHNVPSDEAPSKDVVFDDNLQVSEPVKVEEPSPVIEAVVAPHVDVIDKVVVPHVDSTHKVVPQVDSGGNDAEPMAELGSSANEDAPKKSYLDIVKVAKESASPAAANVVNSTSKTAPPSNSVQNSRPPAPAPAPAVSAGGQQPKGTAVYAAVQQSPAVTASVVASESSAPLANNGHGGNVDKVEDKGFSIYIGGLPAEATVELVEHEFKRFGPIKPGGVQVRSNPNFCFGFVEFETQDAMRNAIETGRLRIGSRNAFIEEKKTNTRVVNGVRSYPSGRGGGSPRNDNFRGNGNFRGQGNYSSGRGYGGRNDNSRRGDLSNGVQNGDGYQRGGYQNGGGGRSGRQAGTK